MLCSKFDKILYAQYENFSFSITIIKNISYNYNAPLYKNNSYIIELLYNNNMPVSFIYSY